jgi:hypothetical protein
MLVIDRDHQVVCLYFMPERQGISSGHRFNDIFDVHIEEGLADWRILFNSILQAEVQILHSSSTKYCAYVAGNPPFH